MAKFYKQLSIIILLTLIISSFSGCIDISSKDTSGDNNEYAEDIEFTLLDGSKKKMSEFKGNIVLLDLFGVNCQPCHYQMAALEEISNVYKFKGVELVSINVWISMGETSELVEELLIYFKEQLNIDLDWTFGVDDKKGTIFNKYIPEGSGVPTIYILDKNGNIYYSNAGYTEYSVLSGILEELINSGGI